MKTSCAKCGEDRKYLIEFHHVDPASKLFGVSDGVNKAGVKIEEEIAKCICLCRNCHTEFHYFYGKRPEYPVEALNEYLGGEATRVRQHGVTAE